MESGHLYISYVKSIAVYGKILCPNNQNRTYIFIRGTGAERKWYAFSIKTWFLYYFCTQQVNHHKNYENNKPLPFWKSSKRHECIREKKLLKHQKPNWVNSFICFSPNFFLFWSISYIVNASQIWQNILNIFYYNNIIMRSSVCHP